MSRPGAFSRTFVLGCLAMLAAQAFAQSSGKTIVMHPNGFAVSQPVTEMPADLSTFANREMPEPRPTNFRSQAHLGPVGPDPVLQRQELPQVGATLGVSFDGIEAQNFAPSDSNLAVGPNHVVETVNVRFAVYSKTGTLLSGPTNFTTLFSSLGNNCAQGASDPIVNYDRQADRWVISDIGYTGSAPFLQCYAVSKSNDPTGAYFLYSFSFDNNLNDYPKVSVWATASNSAYLSSYNIFVNGGVFGGASLCGFDRTKALAGNDTAAQLCQMTPNSEGNYLPGDMDGPTPPVDGTPGLFITWHNNSPGTLYLRKLTLNFSAGTSSLSATTSIGVANDTLACRSCVPQLGTTETLDTLFDRMMYRFAIRHFADHDRAVFSHAVSNGGPVAFRWYEILDPAGTVTLNQQGTFAPDNTYRWMSSMAEDQNGDIGVGYSASSSTIDPAIRFTGRVPSDPAGMLESEASMIEGGGSQTGGLSRWGDYTALQVDPSDDCSFWYVDQYEKVSGSFNWATNIASFKFNGCGGGGTPGATLSTTKLTFGKVVIGQTSNAKSVTLTNTGTATLNIASITIRGDFSISNNACGNQLNVNASCSVSVKFSPAAKNARKGTLTFTDNAPSGTQTVALNGVGVSLSLSPTSMAFGTVPVGTQSPSQTITITNVTNVSVTINSISLAGTNPSDYLINNNTCGASIPGGANCKVSIAFKPLVKGSLPAKLAVSQTGGGGTLTAKLTGSGS